MTKAWGAALFRGTGADLCRAERVCELDVGTAWELTIEQGSDTREQDTTVAARLRPRLAYQSQTRPRRQADDRRRGAPRSRDIRNSSTVAAGADPAGGQAIGVRRMDVGGMALPVG